MDKGPIHGCMSVSDLVETSLMWLWLMMNKDTKLILTDNANRAIQGIVAIQVTTHFMLFQKSIKM